MSLKINIEVNLVCERCGANLVARQGMRKHETVYAVELCPCKFDELKEVAIQLEHELQTYEPLGSSLLDEF